MYVHISIYIYCMYIRIYIYYMYIRMYLYMILKPNISICNLKSSISEASHFRLYIRKETYIYEKRPIYKKRDLVYLRHPQRHLRQTSDYIVEKRPIYMKRDLFLLKPAFLDGTAVLYRVCSTGLR